MNITVTRFEFTDLSTIGKLTIEGNPFTCYTLEDRDYEITQQTPHSDIRRLKQLHTDSVAIPYGTYELAITFSKRFKKLMPQLLEVPCFDGVRLHSGNTSEDCRGCLLTGASKMPNKVYESRVAFNKLYPMLQDACSKEKVYLSIVKG